MRLSFVTFTFPIAKTVNTRQAGHGQRWMQCCKQWAVDSTRIPVAPDINIHVRDQAQEQQALYNQQLRKVQQDANRRAAEVARQQKQRERILQNMQPPNLVRDVLYDGMRAAHHESLSTAACISSPA